MAVELEHSTEQAYQTWLNKGNDFAWASNWEQAVIAYQKAIELREDDPIAYINLGLSLYESGELRKALEVYQRVLELNPGNLDALPKIAEIHARLGEKLQAATSYLSLADNYMKARRPADAVRIWQKVVRYDPMNPIAYHRLANAYKRGRRLDLAAQATLALARIHSERGQEKQAFKFALQAIKLHPDFVPAQQFLALLEANSQKQGAFPTKRGTGPLIRGTDPLSKTGPLDFESLQAEAKGLDSENGSSPTKLAQQRALARLAQDVFDSDAVDLRIETMKAEAIDLQTRGLVEDAARTYEDIIKAGSSNSSIFYNLGILYKTMLRFKEAIKYLNYVSNSADFAMAAHFAIGQCYQSQGRPDEALAYFRDALNAVDSKTVSDEQADEIIGIYEGLIDSYDAKGEQEQVKHFNNKLHELVMTRGWEDKLDDVRLRLGHNGTEEFGALHQDRGQQLVERAIEKSKQYQTQGWVLTAIDELYWVLPLASDYLPLHLQLAELYVLNHREDDAVSKLEMVAEVYLTRTNPTQSIRTLQRALEIAPVDQKVRRKLIDLLMSHGQIDEAINNYIQLADGFYQLVQVDEAIKKLNEGLRLAPRGNPKYSWTLKIQKRLADIYIQQLDWRRAAKAYEGILREQPKKIEVSTRLADLYFKLGKNERAYTLITRVANQLEQEQDEMAVLKFLRNQLQENPDNLKLIKLLGEKQAKQGDIEGAAQSWERVVEGLVRTGSRAQGAGLLRRMIGLGSANEKRYRAMLRHLMSQ